MTVQRPPLGAALYVPAVHTDLAAILRGEKLRHVKEIIICTEDAIAAHELPMALANLHAALDACPKPSSRYCFLRPRHPAIFADIMAHPQALTCFSGAVLPKFCADNMATWLAEMPRQRADGTPFWLMPTLETRAVFDRNAMAHLAAALADSSWAAQILTLRIGGNDLLALLNMRRPRGTTLYETALGKVIADLVTTFIPHGFRLSAPVFEYLDDRATLAREIIADLNHGLTGKTAIHPDQVRWIESHYAVQACDLQAAKVILQPDAKGVFRLDGAMCEPATHRPWAEKVVASAQVFGTKDWPEDE